MHKRSNVKPRLQSLIHILYRFMPFQGCLFLPSFPFVFFLPTNCFTFLQKPDLQMMAIWKLMKGRLKEPSSFPLLDRLFSQRGWNWFFTDWHSSHDTFTPNNWTRTFHFSRQMSWWTSLSMGHRDSVICPDRVTYCTLVVKKERKKERLIIDLFFLTLFTTALHLPLHCKNGLGCKWLVHVKVFSTLILDSRYFYSREEKNISSSCLTSRDSRLYSSLACSVYSTWWWFFFSSLK